jgi:universal stress protein F
MFSSILVPIDLDQPSSWTRSMPAAAAMADAFKAELTLMTVITDHDASARAAWSAVSYGALVEETTRQLAQRADRDFGQHKAAVRVGSGPIYAAILDAAAAIDADLIVMASHRPAMRDFLLGANAARVARHARCSVLIVRD